jgi:hypothetical protein
VAVNLNNWQGDTGVETSSASPLAGTNYHAVGRSTSLSIVSRWVGCVADASKNTGERECAQRENCNMNSHTAERHIGGSEGQRW